MNGRTRGRPRRELEAMQAALGGAGAVKDALLDMTARCLTWGQIAETLHDTTGVRISPNTARTWAHEMLADTGGR